MIPTFVEGTLVSITASFLFDLHKTFNYNRRMSTFTRLATEFCSSYNGTNLDNIHFKTFLKRPSTLEAFRNYFIFSACTYRHNIFSESNPNTYENFLERLTDEAYAYCERRNHIINEKGKIKIFFIDCIKNVEDELRKRVDIDQLGGLYFISLKIDEILRQINSSLPNRDLEEVYEKHRIEYIKMLRTQQRSIWVIGLADIELEKIYISPSFEISLIDSPKPAVLGKLENIAMESETTAVGQYEVFKYSRLITLTGGAGYGKSLFLKNLIHNFEKLNLHNADSLIPIYCDIKRFSLLREKDPLMSIPKFIVSEMIRYTGMETDKINVDMLNYFLESGRCLLLLDAVDEVKQSQRDEIHRLLHHYLSSQNISNCICITSRDRNFKALTDVQLYIKPLIETDVDRYVDKLQDSSIMSPSNIDDFKERTKLLIDSGFLKNFLTLSMLINIYVSIHSIPATKFELYEQYIKQISIDREKQKGADIEALLGQIREILRLSETFENLSYMCFPGNQRIEENDIIEELSPKYERLYGNSLANARERVQLFLNFCSDRTELFSNSENIEEYNFVHDAFYHYFLALYIINESQTDQELWEYVEDLKLEEDICELIGAKKSTERTEIFLSFLDTAFDNLESDIDAVELSSIYRLFKIILSCEYEDYYLRFVKLICANTKLLTQNNLNNSFNQSSIIDKLAQTSIRGHALDAFVEEYPHDLLLGTLMKERRINIDHYENKFFALFSSKIELTSKQVLELIPTVTQDNLKNAVCSVIPNITEGMRITLEDAIDKLY